MDASATTQQSLFVPVDWVPVAAGADALDPPLRGLRADTDCTVTVKTLRSHDTTRAMKFLAGETRWGAFTHVTIISAGAIEGAI